MDSVNVRTAFIQLQRLEFSRPICLECVSILVVMVKVLSELIL